MSNDGTILLQAMNQWSSRPADQRFNSLEELQAKVDRSQQLAIQIPKIQLGSLRVEAQATTPGAAPNSLVLVGKKNVPAAMTHWAFGQLCSDLGIPAHYLRRLPPTMAAQNVNHWLAKPEFQTVEAKMLLESNGHHLVRSLTSNDYGRIWNAQLVRALRLLVQRNPKWQPAPAACDGSRGLYASEEDMFTFLVDNTRKIFEKQEGGLGRFFMMSNSEVGKSSLWLMMGYYEWICGNHRIIGAQDIVEIRLRHTKNTQAAITDKMGEMMQRCIDGDARKDEELIERAHLIELGRNKTELVEAVWSMAKRPPVLTRNLISDSFDLAEREETRYGAPTTLWGFTGGMTQLARDLPNASKRFEIDRAAGKLLQLVAA